MPDVLSVVVSYENPELTYDCVKHLQAQQAVDMVTAVWVNPSPRLDSQNWFTGNMRHDDPSVVFIYADENRLWSPSINEAYRMLKDHYDPTYFMFMNNDIMLPPHAVRSFMNVASDPQVGCVAPWGSALGGRQDFATHYGYVAPGTNVDRVLAGRPPRRAAYVVGACVLMRCDVFEEINGLHEGMPLGADDHWMSMCINHRGYSVMVDEQIYARHVGHASGSSPNWSEWGGKSWEKFNSKWAGYMATEAEAIGHHWGAEYVPEFAVATGWTEQEYYERIESDPAGLYSR